MFEKEYERYSVLNELAKPNGIVIMGGVSDITIPLGELKQTFELDANLYNRSVSGLSVKNASLFYDKCVKDLHPERILLHIGENDVTDFAANPSDFDHYYRKLIKDIKCENKKCDIIIVSLKNHQQNTDVTKLNQHLKYIAESERCEFVDIAVQRVWNPKQTKDIASFVFSTGFVRPLNIKRPAYDLVKILFSLHDTHCDLNHQCNNDHQGRDNKSV